MTAGTVSRMVWGAGDEASSAAPGATFQTGLQEGMTTKDVSPGKYEIFDPSGASLGYGYKPPADTLNDYVWNASGQGITQGTETIYGQSMADQGYEFHDYTNNGVPAPEYWTERPVIGQKDVWLNPYEKTGYDSEDAAKEGARQRMQGLLSRVDTDQERWEAIGQLAGGGLLQNEHGLNDWRTAQVKAAGDPVSAWLTARGLGGGYEASGTSAAQVNAEFAKWHETPPEFSEAGNPGYLDEFEATGQPTGFFGNSVKEEIKGENTLYGSQPVFQDGKLIGYQMPLNMTPLSAEWDNTAHTGKGGLFGNKWEHHDRGAAVVGREISDPDWWKANTVVGQNGNVFVPVEKATEVAGWKNISEYNRAFDNIKTSRGVIGTVMPALIQGFISSVSPWAALGTGAIAGAKSDWDFKAMAPSLVGAVLGAAGAWAKGASEAGAAAEAASKVAEAAGTAGEAASGILDSVKDAVKIFSTGDIKALTGGLIDINASVNKVLGNMVRSAVKTAVASGVSGAELSDVAERALVSGLSSLVGGSVGGATGSSLAGTIAGSATGAGLNYALRDTPEQQQQASYAPTQNTTAASPASFGTGRVNQLIWSS